MRKIAFVFPGQGSQEVGMLTNFVALHAEGMTLFHEASHVLQYDLWKVVQEGPAEILNQTVYTQPAILAADVAIWRIFQSQTKIQPDIMAGHSLGEYAALVASEAVNFQDAIELVKTRATLMQNAMPAGVGGMAAILGLTEAQIISICNEISDRSGRGIEAVNFNAPEQTVVAGYLNLVEEVVNAAKNQGAKKAVILPVSIPAHSTLMQPIAEQFSKVVGNVRIRSPKIPVIQNANTAISSNPDDIRAALVKQLYSPVNWVKTVQKMCDRNIDIIAECGPGKVLSGLNRRINPKVTLLPLNSEENLKQLLENLN